MLDFKKNKSHSTNNFIDVQRSFFANEDPELFDSKIVTPDNRVIMLYFLNKLLGKKRRSRNKC